MSRPLFDCVAEEYDAVRPDYPAQLFDALESAMGQPLLRTDVLDVGAGTGIGSRALAGRGARVVAVEPGEGMLRVLRGRSTARVHPVRGDGNGLPLRDGVFDLVAFAQSMHWTDLTTAAAEAFRVLKPGGVLAAWWNRHDTSVEWFAEHQRRVFTTCPVRTHSNPGDVATLLAQPPQSRRVATVEIPWRRRISVDDFCRALRTQSYVFELGDDADSVVDAELRALSDEFPGGVLDEPFTTYAVLARA